MTGGSPSNAFLDVLQNLSDEDKNAIAEYFRHDLVCIIEEDIVVVLQNLVMSKLMDNNEAKKFQQEQKESGTRCAAKRLVEKLLEQHKGADHLWRALCSDQDRFPSPNLKKILKVIQDKAQDIVHEASSRLENGRRFNPIMKEYQKIYKDSILKETRIIDNKLLPGGRTQEEELLVEHYTELKIVTTRRHTWGQTHHELLLRGREHEKLMRETHKNVCERITAKQLFRICYESQMFPMTVIISGVPGIGKTTLVQKILYDWIQGDEYKKFVFVFLFKFRDMNLWKEPVTLAEIIQKKHPCLLSGVADILKTTEPVLFILDGLDESRFPLDFTEKSLCSDPFFRTSTANIVSSLIKQTMMKCSVVLTSRPTTLERLDMSCFHRYTEIIGFLEEDRKAYFRKQICDQEKALNVFQYVEQNDILYTMCYNPSYCWIICYVLKPYFTENPHDITSCPKTLTQLYVAFINNILTTHARPSDSDLRELLSKISKLAFTGVCNRSLVFYDADLKVQNLEPDQASSGFLLQLLIKEESFQKTVYSFMHLTVQEFLGALSYFLKSSENISQVLENAAYQDGRLEILIRFLAGLSHSFTSFPLQKTVGAFPVATQVEILKWLKVTAENIITASRKYYACKQNKPDVVRKMIGIFYYLFEAQNKELVQLIMGKPIHLDFGDVALTPMDYYVLNYIIVASDEITELDLSKKTTYSSVSVEGIRNLKEAFGHCRSLSLRGNDKLGETGAKYLSEALKSPGCEIRELDLSECGDIGEFGIKCLSEALQSPNCKIQKLNLTKYTMRRTGVKYISEALKSPNCKIQELILGANDGGAEVKHLCEALLSPHCMLQHLDLSNNIIGNDEVACLAKALLSPHSKIQKIE